MENKYNISDVFKELAEDVPQLMEAWAQANTAMTKKKIPYHYNVITMGVRIDADYQLRIQMTRTVTGAPAYYDDPYSIMEAFKKADIIIEKIGTPKAYDTHLRYDKSNDCYRVLRMDAKRIVRLNDKANAMPFINKEFAKHVLTMKPKETKDAYPHTMSFTLKK